MATYTQIEIMSSLGILFCIDQQHSVWWLLAAWEENFVSCAFWSMSITTG